MKTQGGLLVSPENAPLAGPSPKPAWFWLWADWARKGRCKPRPNVPRLIPPWAWLALRQFNAKYPPPPKKPCEPPPPPPPLYRREKALTEAKKWIGTKERTGRNDVLFSDWYGLHGPWCAMFVTYCYVKAGSKAFAPGLHPPSGLHPGSGTYCYVPYIVYDASRNANGLSLVSQPRAGDIVCYDWDGGVADHTGLFVKWLDGDTFQAVEGNTSVNNQSNGGEVMLRTRQRSQVEAFVRVNK